MTATRSKSMLRLIRAPSRAKDISGIDVRQNVCSKGICGNRLMQKPLRYSKSRTRRCAAGRNAAVVGKQSRVCTETWNTKESTQGTPRWAATKRRFAAFLARLSATQSGASYKSAWRKTRKDNAMSYSEFRFLKRQSKIRRALGISSFSWNVFTQHTCRMHLIHKGQI